MQKLCWLLVSLFFLFACEEVYTPDISPDAEQLVVEGYIEAGEQPRPPIVILTRSQPFFSTLDADAFESLFVHNAIVEVSDGDQTIQLTEICYDDLSPAQRALLLSQLGVGSDSLGLNFCVYTDTELRMLGEVGKTYQLRVDAEGETLEATTTIPPLAEVDSFFFTKPSAETPDTLLELRGLASDPAGALNFYRYLTRVNEEPYYAPIPSVVDDRLFDGDSFEFPMPKGEAPNTELDPATFGFFRIGDQATIRWMCIDEAQYDFWNTLEFNAVNQGPFSSYTRIDSNVEGGLGIWGGFSAKYYFLTVEE